MSEKWESYEEVARYLLDQFTAMLYLFVYLAGYFVLNDFAWGGISRVVDGETS